MKKYFVDENGGKFAVPEEQVEGFMKMAADEGKHVSEESVKVYRDAQGTVYDVPESDVEGFLKSAADEGKEIEEDAVANNAGQRVTRAVKGAWQKAKTWMDEGSESGEFLPTAAKGVVGTAGRVAGGFYDTGASVARAVGADGVAGMFGAVSEALPKELPDYGHPALNKAAELTANVGAGYIKYGALGAASKLAVAGDIAAGGVNKFKDTLKTSLESGNSMGKSVGLAAAAAGISIGEAWALSKSALGPRGGILGNMAETGVKMGAGETAQDAVQRAARGEEQDAVGSLKAGAEGALEGAAFGALGGVAHAAERIARNKARASGKAEAEAAVAESEEAKQEAEAAKQEAERVAAEKEAYREKVSALKGEPDAGKQVTGIEEMGVTSWEDAAAKGLIEQDAAGNYRGGARRSINIALNGTEALKAGVKDGTVSAELAEDLITLGWAEMGSRVNEGRTALIDGILDAAKGDEALARGIVAKIENRDVTKPWDYGEIAQYAEEVKAEAVAARQGVTVEEGRKIASEPVETEDGTITTVGETVGAKVEKAGGGGERAEVKPVPETAAEAWEKPEAVKATRLTSQAGGRLGCTAFPELQVDVSSEGVAVRGLGGVEMAKPENAVALASVLSQAGRIAQRNGLKVSFESEEAYRAAVGILQMVKEQGLGKAQKMLDTRAKLFGTLLKNGLGTEVTFDEGSFKQALASTENGRPFVNKHGDILGFVDGKGGIHFNPEAVNFNTPMHEYGHVARAVVEKVNPGLWARGMKLIGETDYYREMVEMSKGEGHPYHGLGEDGLREDALCNMLGDRGKRLIEGRGVGAELKAWIKEFWKAFKGALGIADLTDRQIEDMTVEQIADAINAELLGGRDFGVRRRPSGLTRREAAQARMKREEDAAWAQQAEAEEAAAREAWIASGGTAMDYVKQRIAERGEAPFDLDWETMREMANDRAEGRFAVAGRGTVPAHQDNLSQEAVAKRDKVNEELARIEKTKDATGQNKDGFYREVNKTFGANHTFEMGRPEGMLKGNLPDNPIVLKLKTLLRKRSEAYKNRHPFEFAEVRDIVEKIHHPAILLKNANGQAGVREFFESSSGRAFMVAIRPDGEINDIATLFPKDYERLVRMIKTLDPHDILAVDTEKATRMLKSRYNTASAKDPDGLSDAISLLNSVGESQGGAAGQRGKFSVGKAADIDMSLFTWKRPGEGDLALGETEQGAAGLAAGIEKREALRPWTKAGSPADTAKPIAFDAADMVMFWRAVSGSLRNPHVQKGERIKGRPNAVGLNVGGDRIEIVSRLFGVIDKSDIAKLKQGCQIEGYFRNEDTAWRASRTKYEIRKEQERSEAELDKRTRALYEKRVTTGEGGEHYATQVLGHEIGHTLANLPADKRLGPVGSELKTLFEAMKGRMLRAADPLRRKGDTALSDEVRNLIAWWHGTEEMPAYYEKPAERFAELFGIFLTQPESVARQAPKAYEMCVETIAGSERLSTAYRKITELKWSGKSNDAVMARVRATWERKAQEQYRKLKEDTKTSVSSWRDWFCWALNDRFGPMFGISERGLKAEKKLLDRAVKEGAMSAAEAADRLAAKQAEINALKTSLYDWQRQSGGQTRLMVAGFDEVKANAEKDGVNWSDVRDYAHYMRVIELGGRATSQGVGPARAAAILGDMARELGAEKLAKVEKTWKAYRAVYERFVLEDPNVRELFDEETNKMLMANKHYVTMKHRMGVEEAADWQAKIDAYRKGNGNAWDPCIDIQERLKKGLGGGSGEGESAFAIKRLTGSFEATEDPIAATMMRAIQIKEAAARNHLLKQTSETLRALGAKGVFDTVLAKGGKPHTVEGGVYGKLTYFDGGVKHELIVPKVVEKSFTADPASWGAFGSVMRTIRNTMTLWNPAFVNRAYLIDKSSLETNIKGLHKPVVDILSEALCFKGVGIPLYFVNNYLTRFTPIAKTWVGKLLWNENTVNHYAHRAQEIARMAYEGKFGEHLAKAQELRANGDVGRAMEIEQNVAICQEMLKRNVFQSQYRFNRNLAGVETDDILRSYGYRIGGKDAATWYGKVWEKTKSAGRWANRFEEEQEACTKIIAYLYRMKQDEAAGRTGEADAAARARNVIEYGGTPNLSARGVFASYVENATGFFWNVRKEGSLRTWRALKDHPTEWVMKNLAQTAAPAMLKALMVTGGLEWLIRYLFDDDEKKISRSWWAGPVLDQARFVNTAMKCVPGYYQRNYNVIPIAKFGDEVLSMRVKYSPEEFAIQNLVHSSMQKYGIDPTDPTADWSTSARGVWNEIMPDIFGKNYVLTTLGTLVGPLTGNNPYDQYRQRNVYDQTTWEARALAPGKMAKEMVKSFWNYSPLGTLITTFKDGQERKLEDSDVPAWLDAVLQTPFVRMIPASMLTVTSSDAYTKALEEVSNEQKAFARLKARELLADCIEKGSFGGFDEGLKDVPDHLKRLAVQNVITGWRNYHMDPRSLQMKRARAIKDPNLRRKALQWIDNSQQNWE